MLYLTNLHEKIPLTRDNLSDHLWKGKGLTSKFGSVGRDCWIIDADSEKSLDDLVRDLLKVRHSPWYDFYREIRPIKHNIVLCNTKTFYLKPR